MDSLTVAGVRVDAVGKPELERLVLASAGNASPKVYAYVNVHAVNLARTNDRFRNFINGSDVAYCDGEGIRMAARILGRRLPPRTVLTYWVWDLCRLMQDHGMSVFLLGGRQDVVRKAADVLRERFPRLRIAGTHHGYFDKLGDESLRVVNEVNASGADALFVGFGMPQQELWISDHRAVLLPSVIFPSGSMIDYIAGVKHQTPAWMAACGLEWLYRLVREPRRLWRRYLLGNPRFLFEVFRQRFGGGGT